MADKDSESPDSSVSSLSGRIDRHRTENPDRIATGFDPWIPYSDERSDMDIGSDKSSDVDSDTDSDPGKILTSDSDSDTETRF